MIYALMLNLSTNNDEIMAVKAIDTFHPLKIEV